MNLLKRMFTISRTNTSPEAQSDDDLYVKFSKSSLEKKLFLNVGAGSFRHRFWTNLDKSTSWYESHQSGGSHIEFDLTKNEKLPFEDSSVETIYTSHTIEHVKDEHVQNLFNESLRVLKKGGVLRIVVPDAKKLYVRSKLEDRDWWSWRSSWFLDSSKSTCKSFKEVQMEDFLVREIATKKCRFFKGSQKSVNLEELRSNFLNMDYNRFMKWLTDDLEFDSSFPGNHINYWDLEKLNEFLGRAGFDLCVACSRNESMLPVYSNQKVFDTTQPLMSLYLEAVKIR